ncbi:MAG: DNA-directed RNA polymerase subunit D, partial [Candidatus Methanomethylicia archaeon]
MEIHVDIIYVNNNQIRFVLRNSNAAFANALRRIMISEVPTMAICEFAILNNTSPIYDEILLHRLSLIPLKTDLNAFVLPENCSCGGVGCSKCQVTLILNVKAEDTPRMVYSKDILSNDPRVAPVSDDFPIARLSAGNEISIEMYARLGKGKFNARYQPVSACAYKYLPQIIIHFDKCTKCKVDNTLSCVYICPRKVFDIDSSSGLPYVREPLSCILCKHCVDICKYS